MNFLKNMSLSQKLLWILGISILIIVVYKADDSTPPAQADFNPAAQADYQQTAQADYNQSPQGVQMPTHQSMEAVMPHQEKPSRTGSREVQIYDKGLGMVSATVQVPNDWSVDQDIAYDPNTGLTTRFKLVAIGPRNQYLRSYAGTFPYGNVNNVPFDHALRSAIDHVLAVEKLENLQFGELTPSAKAMRNSRFQEIAQRLANRGQTMEAYKMEFTGRRQGKDYKGYILFTNMANPSAGFGILQPSSILFSLAEDYDYTVKVSDAMDENRVYNPLYSQRMAQISHQVQQRADAYSQQMMNMSAIAHQKRMADRQAAFDSHQKNMAGLNQLQDVAHANYMKTLRSNGSFSTVSSDYSSHNAFIDQTHERTTFQDPWSETQVHLDGQYDYNYTNGLGDYYRTNDPSFNPASLQGNWEQTTPLGP